MINYDVPNKDFLDFGLRYRVALPPHLEQLFRLSMASDNTASLEW